MSAPACGTTAGYIAHFASYGDKTPCGPCKKAHARYRAGLRKRTYVSRSRMRVDALGTKRRIQALQRMGWRCEDIAREAGMKASWVGLIGRKDVILQSSRDRIAAVYDRLSAKRGPSQLTAARSLAKGFYPPLAWNEGEIDNPKAKPEGYLRPSDYKNLVNTKP